MRILLAVAILAVGATANVRDAATCDSPQGSEIIAELVAASNGSVPLYFMAFQTDKNGSFHYGACFRETAHYAQDCKDTVFFHSNWYNYYKLNKVNNVWVDDFNFRVSFIKEGPFILYVDCPPKSNDIALEYLYIPTALINDKAECEVQKAQTNLFKGLINCDKINTYCSRPI